ncbi:[FeFe] hydrogenase H-cluster maturation GTPase HydF [Clostridium septicum]|uniref:[FeFe] hydrogenase H-cluster maturation GTPase HydF n=1 Tax=Clostridium septicum TaxID=1504 RepID=A0A9N7PIC8_CLOSE|nr:[FeFe] hydrogenase H-cluster maturation GTPase HydF [Clostridium septicum]AYE33555.1 [FeFe] hydrogenase H-cluster maturation GTPase HydF [Clostridium septicum]QAS61718.1 [FeFe] hydrogenase H-cluster maturation GTPase HydF [Clostridium septicum]UEC21835.1 [FeFe] hydrogenase H-cluster maturation GTPase HydF [Clostridium septicum]USS00112.1 [FeFe] hydrogenase H-cluster maturation GTPase HydF [Clostridium septicum]
MNNTPNSNRKHIAIYGKTNSGKSSLMNKLLGQEISLVSELEGTTTDPVSKAMELIPVGPVLFIDTAGLNDTTILGEMRVKRTLEILMRTDLALYIMDSNDLDFNSYKDMKLKFKKYNIPYITVINKIDTLSYEKLEEIKSNFEEAVFISTCENQGVEGLKELLIKKLQDDEREIPILGDLVPYNGKVILVVPIDSETPKGRIILPQVQCIRDCLDHGIKSYVVRDTELESALKDIKDVDLVITDSQIFKKVDRIVPKNIKLTSFSILFARHKGDINAFVEGASKVRNLKKNSKILISESCSHNISHEDIGRVKIPKMLNNYIGADLNYEYRVGHDFPENIEEYDLIIHCGACMINRKTVLNRVDLCKEKGIPITNYGVLIAYLTGILDRTIVVLEDSKKNLD